MTSDPLQEGSSEMVRIRNKNNKTTQRWMDRLFTESRNFPIILDEWPDVDNPRMIKLVTTANFPMSFFLKYPLVRIKVVIPKVIITGRNKEPGGNAPGNRENRVKIG